jgi:hypothetical protein
MCGSTMLSRDVSGEVGGKREALGTQIALEFSALIPGAGAGAGAGGGFYWS